MLIVLGAVAIASEAVSQSPRVAVTASVPADVSLYCPLSWTIDVVNSGSGQVTITIDQCPSVEKHDGTRWKTIHGVNGVDCRIPLTATTSVVPLAVSEREGRVGELRDLTILGAAGRYRLRVGVIWPETVSGATESRRTWSDWVEFTVNARQNRLEHVLEEARGHNAAVWRAYKDLLLAELADLIPPVQRSLIAAPSPGSGNVTADTLLSGGVSPCDTLMDAGISGPVLARAQLVKAMRLAGNEGRGEEVGNLLSSAAVQLGTGPEGLYMAAVRDCMAARQSLEGGSRARAESILQSWSGRSPRLHNVERMMRRVLGK